MDTCTETETETSLIVRGKNVRAFNFRRSQPQTKILSRRIIPKLRYNQITCMQLASGGSNVVMHTSDHVRYSVNHFR